jgi:hypothetical protein
MGDLAVLQLDHRLDHYFGFFGCGALLTRDIEVPTRDIDVLTRDLAVLTDVDMC